MFYLYLYDIIATRKIHFIIKKHLFYMDESSEVATAFVAELALTFNKP